MENAANVSVRKGAWSSEEDDLLRDCIRKYGEGKWHLVPLRAGLNRCRKSCRLRWLNYLSPNIKRGCFGDDEVDLIIRLHRLLGNRWSLIAGRLPGRTANDVKNFWNTNICKKPARPAGETDRGKIITSNNIARPRPRTFSSNSQVPAWRRTISESSPPLIEDDVNIINEDIPTKSNQLPSSSAALPVDEEDLNECLRWWADLLYMTENGQEMEGIGDSVHGSANHDAVCGGKFDSS